MILSLLLTPYAWKSINVCCGNIYVALVNIGMAQLLTYRLENLLTWGFFSYFFHLLYRSDSDIKLGYKKYFHSGESFKIPSSLASSCTWNWDIDSHLQSTDDVISQIIQLHFQKSTSQETCHSTVKSLLLESCQKCCDNC